jgi:4-hydroxybenzoate polyprenyltransferase
MIKAVLWFIGILLTFLIVGIVVFFINPILWVISSASIAFVIAYDIANKDSDE